MFYNFFDHTKLDLLKNKYFFFCIFVFLYLLLSIHSFIYDKQAASKNQTSLLGEPPKEIRLSKNPYLNLASVLPSVCLSCKLNSCHYGFYFNF